MLEKALHKDLLIIIESTIPPGTTINVIKPFLEENELRVEKDFYLAYVPERIAPGKAIHELLTILFLGLRVVWSQSLLKSR